LKSVHRRFPRGLLLVSSANSLPAATIFCALQWWLGVHRTRPDHRRAREACVGGFSGPGAIFAVRTPQRKVDKGLLAGDAALRPAHCPTFLPVIFRKCFVMLLTAQNRCGVFAGIGIIMFRPATKISPSGAESVVSPPCRSDDAHPTRAARSRILNGHDKHGRRPPRW
jgi:hypothetical protein